MSLASTFGKKLALFVASTATLISSGELAVAQDITKDNAPAKAAEVDRSDAAIFAKYDRLDAPETRTRLAEFLGNPAMSRSLDKAVAAMSGKKVDAKALEQAVTPLVAGRVEDDASVSMDAIMRHYYNVTLSEKSLKAAEAEKNLEDRATALDDAVYGKPIKDRTRRSIRALNKRHRR
ncbi:MAG: hypothetical protein VX475_05135 [Myxococcota bacterium]|jgi:hypothetical protein|nr:hypothetical protein [Myxococcota bacterium]